MVKMICEVCESSIDKKYWKKHKETKKHLACIPYIPLDDDNNVINDPADDDYIDDDCIVINPTEDCQQLIKDGTLRVVPGLTLSDVQHYRDMLNNKPIVKNEICKICKTKEATEYFDYEGIYYCADCNKEICEFCKINKATEYFEYGGIYYCTDCEESHKCDNCGYIHNKMIYTGHTDKFGDKLKKKCSLPCF